MKLFLYFNLSKIITQKNKSPKFILFIENNFFNIFYLQYKEFVILLINLLLLIGSFKHLLF